MAFTQNSGCSSWMHLLVGFAASATISVFLNFANYRQTHKYTNTQIYKYKYTNYTFLNFAIGNPKLDSTTDLRFKRTVIVTHLTLFSSFKLIPSSWLGRSQPVRRLSGASFGLVTSLPSDKPTWMKSILPFVTRP